MPLSLRLTFKQNHTNHLLDRASLTLFLFKHKPLIQLSVNALLEDGQTQTTPSTLLSQKNKRKSEHVDYWTKKLNG
jgi:hypothetical protein